MEHPLQELAQAAEKTSESEQMNTTEMKDSADDEIIAEDSDKKPSIEDDACDSKPSTSHSSEIVTCVDEAPEMCVNCKLNPIDVTCDTSLTAPNKICHSCKLKMEDSTSKFDLTDKTPEPTNNTETTTTTAVTVHPHPPSQESSSSPPHLDIDTSSISVVYELEKCCICKRSVRLYSYELIEPEDKKRMKCKANLEVPRFDQIKAMLREGKKVCTYCQRESRRASSQVSEEGASTSRDHEENEMADVTSTEHGRVGARQAVKDLALQAVAGSSGMKRSKQPGPFLEEIDDIGDIGEIPVPWLDESIQECNTDETTVQGPEMSSLTETSGLISSTLSGVVRRMRLNEYKKMSKKTMIWGGICLCLALGITIYLIVGHYVKKPEVTGRKTPLPTALYSNYSINTGK